VTRGFTKPTACLKATRNSSRELEVVDNITTEKEDRERGGEGIRCTFRLCLLKGGRWGFDRVMKKAAVT
jgi:hypothetical protein